MRLAGFHLNQILDNFDHFVRSKLLISWSGTLWHSEIENSLFKVAGNLVVAYNCADEGHDNGAIGISFPSIQ